MKGVRRMACTHTRCYVRGLNLIWVAYMALLDLVHSIHGGRWCIGVMRHTHTWSPGHYSGSFGRMVDRIPGS